MRVSLKIMLAVALPLLLLVSVSAVLRIERESRVFDLVAWRDQRSLAVAVAAAAADGWRAGGDQLVQRIILDANRDQPYVDLSWVVTDSVASLRLSASDAAVLAAGGNVERVEENAGEIQRVSLHPVVVDGKGVGILKIESTEMVEKAYRLETIIETITVGAVALLIGSAATLLVGFLLVGRRVHEMVATTKRVAGGNLSLRVHRRRSADELGALDDEIEAMIVALAGKQERIEHETAKRIQALDQLRHADRLTAVGRLAAGLAHELGTPLNVVMGRARLIADAEVTGNEARDNAAIVAREAERMSVLIRRLLDFSRRSTLAQKPTDVASVVRHVAELLSSLARASDVEIEVAGGSSVTMLPADQEQLEQALVNLAMNGIQAMPKGGRLTFQLARVSARAPNAVGSDERAWLKVSVEDEGSGIAPEIRDHIYDPFFTTKPVGEGTGLGLSIVHSVIEDHGGFIRVESEPGKGSRFHVHLPMPEAAP